MFVHNFNLFCFAKTREVQKGMQCKVNNKTMGKDRKL